MPQRFVLYDDSDAELVSLDYTGACTETAPVIASGRPHHFRLFDATGDIKLQGRAGPVGCGGELIVTPGHLKPTMSWPILGLIDCPISFRLMRPVTGC